MSNYGQIEAQPRSRKGKGPARRLRAEGRVPAVMYGGERDAVLFSVGARELSKAFDPEREYNTLFTITMDGKTQTALIADRQIDVLRGDLVHVDFMRVDPEKPVVRTIPVRFHGRPAGVAAGGKLATHVRNMKVRCKPTDTPVALNVDTSPMNTGDSIRFADISLENCEILENPERSLATVAMPKKTREEKAEEARAAADDAAKA